MIEVIDLLKPKNNSNFPIVDMVDVKGGTHYADTIEARDAIPASKRVLGLQCFVASNKTLYVLKEGIENSDWEEFKSKGGVHISDTAPVDDDKSDIAWIIKDGDKIELPDDPTNPTMQAIRETLIDYQNRLDRLEYLVRGIIDGGTVPNSSAGTRNIDPNIDRALIQFKRGSNANIAILQAGEPAVALDTKDVYIGDGAGGKIHVNSAKNLTSNRLLLTANNDKTFAVTVSPEGYLNVTEYIEKIIPPDIIGDYDIKIFNNIKVATRGDHVLYNYTIIYQNKTTIFNVAVSDSLLIDNMLINEEDVTAIECNLTTQTSELFRNGIIIPKLKYGDIINISYYLQINNTIHENITNTLLGKSNTIEIY